MADEIVDRQHIIERAINLEHLLCSLVTHHFFPNKALKLSFFHGVMLDPLANSAFRINVFWKCYPGFLKGIIEKLRRIFSIRNIFAHAGLYVTTTADPDAMFFMDPKNKDKRLDFDSLAEEFDQKVDECERLLGEMFEAGGIELHTDPF